MAEEESSSGTTIVNRLQQKAGPLPVWGWVGIIIVVGYVYYKHKQNLAAANANTPTGPVTVQNGGSGLVSDTGTQEQLNDINAGISNANTQLATIGTNVGAESKNINQISTVVTRPANLHDPADVQHYFLVHNQKTGKYYYVNPSEQTSFTLTDAAAKGNLKYKPKVYNSNKVPVFKQGKLVYV